MNKEMMNVEATCDSDFDIAHFQSDKNHPFACRKDLFSVCLEDGWSISMDLRLAGTGHSDWRYAESLLASAMSIPRVIQRRTRYQASSWTFVGTIYL